MRSRSAPVFVGTLQPALACGDSFLQFLFYVFERASFGFGNDAEKEEEAEDAEGGVQPEGACLGDRVDEGEHRGGDDEVEHPVGDAARGRAFAADLQGVDLGVEQPDADAEGGGERGDVDHETNDEDDVHQGGLRWQEVGEAEHDQAQRHAPCADEQEGPASYAVDGEQGRARNQAVDEADAGGGQDGPRIAEAGVGENARGVVDDGVYADHLVDKSDPDPDREGGPVAAFEEVAVGGALLGVLGAGDGAYLLLYGGVALAGAGEHGAGLVVAVHPDQPAGALGQEEHAHEEGKGRHHAEGEHPAPGLGVGEQVVDPVREQDADRDQELLQGDERATHPARGGLGYVDGNHHPGAADGQPEHEARNRQERGTGRQRRGQRPDYEDGGRGHDGAPTPDPVRQRTAEQGPEHGSQ